jgi:hypothetical protein
MLWLVKEFLATLALLSAHATSVSEYPTRLSSRSSLGAPNGTKIEVPIHSIAPLLDPLTLSQDRTWQHRVVSHIPTWCLKTEFSLKTPPGGVEVRAQFGGPLTVAVLLTSVEVTSPRGHMTAFVCDNRYEIDLTQSSDRAG